jgi:hypothetical protein
MISPLDVFKLEADGQLVWKAAAQTLEAAKLHVQVLMASEPADYVIFSQQTGHKTIIKADRADSK